MWWLLLCYVRAIIVLCEGYICLFPSVTGEVYCFPRRQVIFSFGRRVVYHSKGLWEYIPKSIPSVCLSVCTTIFKLIAGLRFYLKYLMLSINGFVSTSSINEWKVYSNFKFVFELVAENRKIFKQIARLENWSKCNVLYINFELVFELTAIF